jgi:hypothetical protein
MNFIKTYLYSFYLGGSLAAVGIGMIDHPLEALLVLVPTIILAEWKCGTFI